MLVLSRSEGESLLIGDDVVVTITRIRGDNVRIGISAPKDTKIVRSELDVLFSERGSDEDREG